MNWEQKFLAMKAIGEASLHMRQPSDWYVLVSGVEVKNGPMLESCGASGATPEEAVNAKWTALTDLKPDTYLVSRAYGVRSAFRWNGFMWAPVHEA